MPDKRIGPEWLFVDGSSLIFRAFFAVPRSVKAPDGHLVNAVRGFLETLVRMVGERRPARLAVADDADWRPAWRVELIPGYKAHRVAEPIPPELAPQMPIIHAFLDAVGIDFVGVPGYEAEDVIATWTAKAPGTVEILSGDRDLFALVEDPRVCVLYPEKAGLARIDEAEVARRYGIGGRSYADFAILRGDPSDGLPGLKGVGAVAAAGLLRTHGDVPGVLRDASLKPADRDYLERAARVVPPVAGLALDLPAGSRSSYPADPAALTRLVALHGLEASATRLAAALGSRPA